MNNSTPTLLLHPELADAQLAFFFSNNLGGFLFRGIDVGKSLGYANPSRSIRSLVDKNWVLEIDDGTAKGNKVLYLTEAGFYQLCFSSNLDRAIKFRKWVFEDVLTSIIKNGYYLSPTASSEQLQALQNKVEEQQKLIAQLQTQKQQSEQMRSKP